MTDPRVRIRRAGPDDVDEALVDDPDRVGLLAEIGGGLVGGLMGSFPELTPFVRLREARLNSLWVLPDHRGAGVGGPLVDAFLDRARERGAPYGFGPHTLRTPL